MFQFHSGSIKREAGRQVDGGRQSCFNSIVVRLKGFIEKVNGTAQTGFNSIVVRLKEAHRARGATASSLFQFHSGSIKSKADSGF